VPKVPTCVLASFLARFPLAVVPCSNLPKNNMAPLRDPCELLNQTRKWEGFGYQPAFAVVPRRDLQVQNVYKRAASFVSEPRLIPKPKGFSLPLHALSLSASALSSHRIVCRSRCLLGYALLMRHDTVHRNMRGFNSISLFAVLSCIAMIGATPVANRPRDDEYVSYLRLDVML
jgi:hypothetical protein